MRILQAAILFFVLFLSITIGDAATIKLHPMNKKLIEAGVMKDVPKYFPEIPRLEASMALRLYKANKALFVFISYSKEHLIKGAVYLTEGKAHKIDPNRLPLKKGQVLVIYCA